MKDHQLENTFDEYFDGVQKPEEITADAKKLVKRKKSFGANFVKYASIAACALLICTTAILSFNNFFPSNNSANESGNNFAGTNSGDTVGGSSSGTVNDSSSGNAGGDLSETLPPSDADNAQAPSTGSAGNYYTKQALTANNCDAYSLSSLSTTLGFIQNLAYSKNASVESCIAYTDESVLTLVEVSVTSLFDDSRQDVKIYVEYTSATCDELADFADGKETYYENLSYTYYQTTQNGEPTAIITTKTNGVKYYLTVQSTAETSYLNYIKMIIQS